MSPSSAWLIDGYMCALLTSYSFLKKKKCVHSKFIEIAFNFLNFYGEIRKAETVQFMH